MGKKTIYLCDNNGCTEDATKGFAIKIDFMNGGMTLEIHKNLTNVIDAFGKSPLLYACGRGCLTKIIHRSIEQLEG